jgi:hypothetical protein
VNGGDHVGRSNPRRDVEALEFLGRVLEPAGPDPAVEQFRALLAPAKKSAGIQ